MAREKATADELDAHATANGYQRGGHWEEDSRRDGNKHGVKTRSVSSFSLQVLWIGMRRHNEKKYDLINYFNVRHFTTFCVLNTSPK
jgi:hypothetical protein